MKINFIAPIVLLLSVCTSFGLTTLNVTNYGAVGDALQFYVNTSSNSTLVTTTNNLPASYIGDAIEIYKAGVQTHGINTFQTNAYGNQDLIGYVTSISGGTNIYINLVASNTLVDAFATIGHDNEANFNSAIDSSTDTDLVIDVPAGDYLFLATNKDITLDYYSIALSRGGLTINGAGTNATRLLGQGSWQIRQQYYYWTSSFTNEETRGWLFEEYAPSNVDYPAIVENMTIDGGLAVARLSSTNSTYNNAFVTFPANNVDGLGWDSTHSACAIWSTNIAPNIVNTTWTNLLFQHWQGEIVKGLDGATNGNNLVEDCVFYDGNADAVNFGASMNISNNVFDDVVQSLELYENGVTNVSYFQYNLCTNVGGLISINGGDGPSQIPFIINDNTFYWNVPNLCGVQLCPADNITISNNLFVCSNWNSCISTLSYAYGYNDGGRGFDTTNVMIYGNTFVNPGVVLNIQGGTNATSVDRAESIYVESNTVTMPYGGNTSLFLNSGWCTNVYFYSNNCSSFSTLTDEESATFSTNPVTPSPYPFVSTNNDYWYYYPSYAVATNYISYGLGSRFVSDYSANGSVYVIVNSDANSIPDGAQILFANENGFAITVYLDSLGGHYESIGSDSSLTFYWSGGGWSPAW